MIEGAKSDANRSLFRALLGDGRPAISLTAIALMVSGGFAIFLASRREFLPHDVAFLGMTSTDLCAIAECRVVHFMFHDRVAFGGTLLAISVLYLWLAAFPLREGLSWSWWALAVSGVIGFGSFLTYLSYGYLDSWHGTATLVLLPVFVIGLIASRPQAARPLRPWLLSDEGRRAPRLQRIGRWMLVATGAGILLAGSVILYLGATEVFVAEDLAFMGITRATLDVINPKLVPLIAHDRAGFGGGLATTGALLIACAWYARPSRSFYEAIALAGITGFGAAIGTHFVEGYMNPVHLAPALPGGGLFAASLVSELAGARSRSTSV